MLVSDEVSNRDNHSIKNKDFCRHLLFNSKFSRDFPYCCCECLYSDIETENTPTK